MEILVQKAEPEAKQMQVCKEMVRQRLGKPLLLQRLAEIEAAAKPAITFAEAMETKDCYRCERLEWKSGATQTSQFTSLSYLSLVASDTAFATKVSQVYRQTNVKIVCNDASFWPPWIFLTSNSLQEPRRMRRKRGNKSIAAFTSAQKGCGRASPPRHPFCRDFLTDGCPRGGQCTFQHPQMVGRCLRRGSTKHAVADCKRRERMPLTTSLLPARVEEKDPKTILHPRHLHLAPLLPSLLLRPKLEHRKEDRANQRPRRKVPLKSAT